MDFDAANEISAEDFTNTSPLTPPVRVSMLLLMVIPPAIKETGPAIVKSEFTVNAVVLPELPKVSPVSVLAKLYALVLNALANVLLAVGSMVNTPTPVNAALTGRVLFWKTKRPADTAVLPL